ncbi:MAG: HlyD family efflux transporter periplasmic adaptor subunit [Candidatus Kapabacteria bacterium]|nr:HlyD family efflux transporter periplasmic adaptor subunit [Candidatus Kapabacteria bacterium]
MMRYISFLLLLFVFTNCSTKDEYITPKRKTIIETVFASGIVEPINMVTVYSSVSGIISSINVQEGENVPAGTTLFELQTTGAEFQVQSALANQEYTNKAFADKSPQLQAVLEEVAVTKKRFEYDSSLYTKKLQLLKERAISAQEMETSRLAYESSKAAYQATMYKFDATKTALLRDKNVSKAQYNLAKTSANNYKITALQSGFVWSIPPKVGSTIVPSTPLAILGNETQFLLKLQVDPSDIGLIKLGQKVLFTVDALGDSIFEGTVAKIGLSINEKTQTFEVEANCPTLKMTTIKSNIEANIVVAEKANALVIPREYLYGTSIYLSDNGSKPTPKKIQIGLKNLEYVEITDKSISEKTPIYLKPL